MKKEKNPAIGSWAGSWSVKGAVEFRCRLQPEMRGATAPPGEVTALLKQVAGGDRQALDRFTRLVYRELRRLAGYYMGRERVDHTLQPTALVHEAYLRLFGRDQIDWQNHSHFVCGAARAMRQILVDHARRRARAKRAGGQEKVSLEESAIVVSDQQPEMLLALDESLARLESLDPRQAEIVEMLYFTGMTQQEAAKALGLSEITVRREWRLARAWLRSEMRKGSSA